MSEDDNQEPGDENQRPDSDTEKKSSREKQTKSRLDWFRDVDDLRKEYNLRTALGAKLINFEEDLTIEDKKERLDRTVDSQRRQDIRDIIDGTPRPTEHNLGTSGVLLRDEILYYQRKCDLISEFDPDSLKPAAYQLRVGDQYSVEGEKKELGPGEYVEIPPFQVAIIKTRERVNLPHFIIGRWNIKVSKAYDGLLWVGGPQVDPGYSGYLFCPIYNLSDTPVKLDFKEQLAVIDFTKTTPFDKGDDSSFEEEWMSLDEPWDEKIAEKFENPPKPDRYKNNMQDHNSLLLEDYDPEKLKSALFSEVNEELDDVRNRVDRIDNVVRLSFAALVTIVAILFSVLSVIVSSDTVGGQETGELLDVSGITVDLISLAGIFMIAIIFLFFVIAALFYATRGVINRLS